MWGNFVGLSGKAQQGAGLLAILTAIGVVVKFTVDLVDGFYYKWKKSLQEDAKTHREITEQVIGQLRGLFDAAKAKIDWERERAEHAEEERNELRVELKEREELLRRHRKVIRQLVRLIKDDDSIPISIDIDIVDER